MMKYFMYIFVPVVFIVIFTTSHAGEKNCKPAHGEVSYEDADGNTDEFSNQEFTVRRVRDQKIIFKGRIDSNAKAKWKGGCKGDKFAIQMED